MNYHRFANGIVLSDRAFWTDGMTKMVERIWREERAAEERHAEELKQRRRERREARKAAPDFSEFA